MSSIDLMQILILLRVMTAFIEMKDGVNAHGLAVDRPLFIRVIGSPDLMQVCFFPLHRHLL